MRLINKHLEVLVQLARKTAENCSIRRERYVFPLFAFEFVWLSGVELRLSTAEDIDATLLQLVMKNDVDEVVICALRLIPEIDFIFTYNQELCLDFAQLIEPLS